MCEWWFLFIVVWIWHFIECINQYPAGGMVVWDMVSGNIIEETIWELLVLLLQQVANINSIENVIVVVWLLIVAVWLYWW